MTDLHEMTMDELQAELKKLRAIFEGIEEELDDARDDIEEIEAEIDHRNAEDRDKLAEWNASVRAAKQAGGVQ